MPYTQNQVSGIGLDQYRAAVNYDDVVNRPNRANKGYVRFVSGGRSVSLAKVNNKIDVAIGARLGVNAANNRLVREQFLNAISGDLAYLPKDQADRIRAQILGGTEAQATPLSRRDIRQAFAYFDGAFNTSDGRRRIVENVLREAALAHDFGRDGTVDVAGFCRQAFDQTPEAFLDRYAQAFEDLPNASDVDKAAGRAMLMDESEFRGLLITIREVADACANVAETNRTLRDTVRGWVLGATKGSYGFALTESDRESWMKALRPVVAGFDCQKLAPEGTVGVNYGEKLLELFVDNILSHELKAALDNVFQAGVEDNAQLLEEALEAYVSYDSIENLAIEFFSRASDPKTLAEIGKLATDASDDPMLAKGKGLINDTVERFLKVGTFASAKMDTMLKVFGHASVTRAEAGAIGTSVCGALNIFAQEARLEWFVRKFVADRYGQETSGPLGDASTSVMKGQIDKARAAADLATVAAQTVHGIRIVNYTEKDGKKVVESAYSGKDGMGQFANKVFNTLTRDEILGELKCDMSDLCEFASLTFPNVYADIKADLLKALGGEAKEQDLFSDDNAAKVVLALKDAYRAVRTELAGHDREVKAFEKSFLKILDRHVKGGKLTQTQADEVRARLATERRTVRAAAARELARLMPLGTDVTRAKQARWIMADAVQTLRAHMTHGLALLVRANSYGAKEMRELDSELNIRETVAAWKNQPKHAGTLGSDPFRLHFVADEELESRLYPQLVTDFETSLTAKVGKTDARLKPGDVSAVRADFTDKVAKRLSAYRDFEAKFLKDFYEAGVASTLDGLSEHARFKVLSKADRKALVGEVVRAAMLTCRNEIREKLFEAVDHGWKTDRVSDLVKSMTDQDALGPKVNAIMRERAAEFDRWMEGGQLRTRLEADVFAAVKGKLPEGVTETELQRMIAANGQAFFAQAEQVKEFTVSGGKLAFCQKASEAILNGLDRRLAAFAAFKKDFLAKVPEIDAKYATLPDKALVCANFLAGLASEDPKSLKAAREADAYDKALYARLNNFIEAKEEDLARYRLQYVRAFEHVRDHVDQEELPELAERLNVAMADVDGEGLDRNALAAEMTETFRKEFMDLVSYEIARDPRKLQGDLGKVVTPAFRNFAARTAANLKLFQAGAVGEGQMDPELAPWARLDDLVKDLGYGRYLAKNNLLTDRLHAHLNTFMKSAAFKALHENALRAAAAHALSEISGVPVPTSAADAILAYRQAVADEIESFVATACSVDRLNADIPLAKAFIDLELANRKLPDETDAYGANVRTRTQQDFAEAVKREADKMFAATKAGSLYVSQLMTRASLDAFVARIEADCYTTYAHAYVENLADEIFGDIVAREGEFAKCFADPQKQDDEGARLAAAVRLNRAELRSTIVDFMWEETHGCLSYDDLVAQTGAPEFRKRLNAKLDKALASTLLRCLSRVTFESDLAHAVDTATASFERALMRWMFATPADDAAPFGSLDEILADPRVKKDTKLTDGEKWSNHRMAIRNCCANFRQSVDRHLKAMRAEGVSATRKVADVVRDFGNTYLDDILCNEKALKETKDLTKDYAKAVADAIGYKIPQSRTGIFGLIKRIF